jgi:predicted dithiol-disulfide oxidoreductase (DUF899 family)
MSTTALTATEHPIVSRTDWLLARRALLAEEKELSRHLDTVAARRRALPWVRVEKPYVFEGPNGRTTLADLFRGRSQLIVYHFMFAPGWNDGCTGCSFLADHVDGARQHFEHHDVAFAAVSRAPYPEFARFKTRMGWTFNWVSSHGSSFNYDFRVSFTPEQVATGTVDYNYGSSPYALEDLHGLSVFHRLASGEIVHTYSTYARGVELLVGTLHFLDLTPNGRNEDGIQNWVRHHDRYEPASA